MGRRISDSELEELENPTVITNLPPATGSGRIIDVNAMDRCIVRCALVLKEMIDSHDAGDDTTYHVLARGCLEYMKEQLSGNDI